MYIIVNNVSYIVESGKELQDFPAFYFENKKSMCITGTHTSKQYTQTELEYIV